MTEARREYSQAAEEALQRSVLLASDHRLPYATVATLLLAIVEEPRSDASKTLAAIGVKMRSLRRNLSKFSSSDDDGGRQLDRQGQPSQMSSGLYRAIERAHDNARREQVPTITTRDLLLGSIDQASGDLQILLQEQGVDANLVRAKALQVNEIVPLDAPELEEKIEREAQRAAQPQFMISPVFLLIAAVAIGSGYVLYTLPDYVTPALFVFVISGWVVSLALHEFGHALAAFYGGDYSVVDKGYLTLNPLKYTHGVLSIVMPVVILLMGGIGLPGGAVYINRAAIRSPIMHSVISAAGPFANLLFAAGLTIFYVVAEPQAVVLTQLSFWSGITLLILLQITAIVLNLLPVPGLDGFGIIAPWLPLSVLQALAPFYGYGFMLLFMLFWISDDFSSWFWSSIIDIMLFLGVEPSLAFMGLETFMFWQ